MASRGICRALIVPVGFLAAATLGQEPGSVAYVQGSRVNLRVNASSNAAVVGNLTTNTEVEVLGRTSDWCEVEVRPGRQRGFVACDLLAPGELTLASIEARLQGEALSPEEALDWHSRAFWVAPSLSRWLAAGFALEQARLTSEIQSRESELGKPQRPKVPEFDAMKEALARGITVSPPLPRPVKWASEALGNLYSAMQRASLPAVTGSYFRGADVPFAIPVAPFTLEHAKYAATQLADTLSAVHQVPLRVRVAGSAYLLHVGGGADYSTIAGLWDVGRIEVTFEDDVLIHGVTARGERAAVVVQSMLYDFDEGGCGRSYLQIKTKPVRDGALWSSAIVSWVGKPPPSGKAMVNTRESGGENPYDKLVVHDIDLDSDGIADLSSWAGRYEPVAGAEGYWNVVFGNVDGTWMQLAYDEDDDCT